MNAESYWDLIFADVERYVEYGGFPHFRHNFSGKIRILLSALLANNQCIAFTVWLRILQSAFYPPPLLFGLTSDNYKTKSASKPLRILAYFMHRKLRRKFGLEISPHTQIGPGLYLGHGIGLIINCTAKIGSRCSFSQFTTIGSVRRKAAEIGNDVYIGPNVCIVENVKIGNHVKIGAGTVVINDIPDNSTSVGNPNRIIQR